MYKDYQLAKSPNVYDTLEHKPEHQQIWAGARRFADREALEIMSPAMFGCNSYVDSEIGRIADVLDAFPVPPAVLYTSDHGVMLESHCLYAKGPAAYEEICHVPFILKGLGKGVVDTPVSHIDVTPTVWDFFGFSQPIMMQGTSLLPLAEKEGPERRDVFIEFGRYETDHDGFGGFQPMRCIFDGRYKLVVNLLSSDEFYDLEEDPWEMVNLIEDPVMGEIRDGMLKRLLDHMNDIRDPFRGYCWERRPWNHKGTPPSWDYTGYTRQRSEPDYEPQQLDYDTGLTIKNLVRKK